LNIIKYLQGHSWFLRHSSVFAVKINKNETCAILRNYWYLQKLPFTIALEDAIVESIQYMKNVLESTVTFPSYFVFDFCMDDRNIYYLFLILFYIVICYSRVRSQARVSDLGWKYMTRLIIKPVFILKVSKTKKKNCKKWPPLKYTLS
jgi:hypothetical protein